MTKKDCICFGGGDWWYHNRGHIDMQLMRRFARNGTVVYVNSIVIQKPKFGKKGDFLKKLVRKTKSIIKGLKKSGEGFWVYSPFTLPVHHLAWARPLNELLLRIQMRYVIRKLQIHEPIIWVVCPGACDTAIRLQKSKLVYQRTDRHEEFPGVDKEIISRYDRTLKVEADMTLYVNTALYEEEKHQCRRAFYLDHGVDFATFSSVGEDQNRPMDIASIPGPIAGYFGALDEHKLDINFLEETIDLVPEISFVFVGEPSPKFLRLAEKKNVWLLGQKPYEQIPHYGKCFDVALIPWRRNRWTEAANPIKLKEYLALGKPLVSTPVFTELQDYLDVAYGAETPRNFANCIKDAIKQNNSELVAKRKEKVKSFSWDSKAVLVLRELLRSD